ncbi:MAG: phage holin family protein [Chthoniobacterales bacterium]|nr:phage holin family protein [Chthoniobacterales bacterium]
MREAIEPSITEMLGRLGADSQQLVADEVRLAKLELNEGARHLSRGLAGVVAAFGIAIIAATAATVLAIMLAGNLTGNLSLGALIVGALELLLGLAFYKRGRASLLPKAATP